MSLLRTPAWPVVLVLLAGCGREPAVVSGNVNYDGKPLPSGYVSVVPAEGEGVSSGAKVVDGRYQVEGLTPGSYRVTVTTPPDYEVDPNSKAKLPLKAVTTVVVPPNALGNSRVVELRPGPQTADFELKKPPVVNPQKVVR